MLLFVIQSVVLCLLFTILLAALFFKQDPVKGIMSYPPAVRKRVAALPQYRDRFAQIKRGNIAAKIISGLAIALLVAILLWFSGLRSFVDGFLWGFGRMCGREISAQ